MVTSASAEADKAYVCSSIEVLDGVEAVRRRPGMYIGDTADPHGLEYVVIGFVENSLRQHLQGRCQRIEVRIHRHGGISVADDGPGIPRGSVRGMPLLERLVTTLSFGGRRSRGLDLLGASLGVASAVAQELVVEVACEGTLRRLRAARGRLIEAERTVGGAATTGTRVFFDPDPLIFQCTEVAGARLFRRMRELAFLCPGLIIDVVDARPGGRTERYRSAGLPDWIGRLTEGRLAIPDGALWLRGNANDIAVEAAIRWVERPLEPRILSFVNRHPTAGGSHVEGLLWGIRWALTHGARLRPRATRKRLNVQQAGHGLVAVLHIEHQSPRFCQVRRCLYDDRAAFDAVREVVSREIREVLGPLRLQALHTELTSRAHSPVIVTGTERRPGSACGR